MKKIASIIFLLLSCSLGAQRVIDHDYFLVNYNEAYRQPNCVSYVLTSEHLKGFRFKRTDDFRKDRSVGEFSSSLYDYRGSGYDRGHLCPAADRAFSSDAISRTFLLSNIAPQAPCFNRGIWRKLEGYVRDVAEYRDSVLVVTGPIFINNIDTIGVNRLPVAGYFFKALYVPDSLNPGMEAYILRNKKSNLPISIYRTSVDSLESILGIDLFDFLPDGLEDRLERMDDIFGVINIDHSDIYIDKLHVFKKKYLSA